MTNNSLSIHIESGDIFYDNFNTNENFYSCLLAQQDESKQVVPTVLKTTLKTTFLLFV